MPIHQNPSPFAIESRWIRYRDEFVRRIGGNHRQLRKRDFEAGFRSGWEYHILTVEVTKSLESLVDFMDNATPEQKRLFREINKDEIEILQRWLREGQK